MKIFHYFKSQLLAGFALLLACSSVAQTDMDGIMMNKNQFCNGLIYDHASWDHYWEGTLKRNNENLGTVSTQSVMYMGNYGITKRINVMVSAPYVWTNASAGTLHGMDGVQDISLMVKWKALNYAFGQNKLALLVIGGFSAPLTDYVIDYLPLSIGLGSSNLTGRAMVDYQWKRWTATGSSAYIARSNVKLDRTSYYDTQLHSTNEVEMPNALQSQLRLGYRGKYLIAEALLSNWITLGGFDITRNNMPFPSNKMNSTSVGANVKYTIKKFTNLALILGGEYTIAGRNVGQTMAFHGGAFYAFYFSKKDKPKNVSTY